MCFLTERNQDIPMQLLNCPLHSTPRAPPPCLLNVVVPGRTTIRTLFTTAPTHKSKPPLLRAGAPLGLACRLGAEPERRVGAARRLREALGDARAVAKGFADERNKWKFKWTVTAMFDEKVVVPTAGPVGEARQAEVARGLQRRWMARLLSGYLATTEKKSEVLKTT